MQNAFAAAGKYLPRTASQQFAQAPVHVPLSQAQPGDLLVWGSAPGFYHVAIYLGGGRVVQALNPDAGITVTDLASMSGMQLHPVRRPVLSWPVTVGTLPEPDVRRARPW